jgi:hypothetical protein
MYRLPVNANSHLHQQYHSPEIKDLGFQSHEVDLAGERRKYVWGFTGRWVGFGVWLRGV